MPPTSPADNQPLVSLVILLYNSAEFVGACLESVAASDYQPLEVVVVDNASHDGSLQIARETAQKIGLKIEPVGLDPNRGCAGGNNAGWRASHGEIVVFLNPDTRVTPSFIHELIAPLTSDGSIGITGAKIFYPDSRILQHAGGILYPNAMSDHYGVGQEDRGQFDTPKDVDYVTGAGFAIRRALLEKLDGFDEDYFPAYFEETDLCVRVRRAGYRIVYEPKAVLYHYESVSLTVNSPAFHRLYQRMRIRFLLKNYSPGDWLKRFLPFEARWMLREPRARGHRREQFRAYAEGLLWLAKKGFRTARKKER